MCAHNGAEFGTVGSDRLEQTNPKRSASRRILAVSKARARERKKVKQTSQRCKAARNKPQAGNRRSRQVETVKARHCYCPVGLTLISQILATSLTQRAIRTINSEELSSNRPISILSVGFRASFRWDCTSA